MSLLNRIDVPDHESFVRYFSGGRFEGEKLVAGAMLIPPDHDGEMSINRLSIFSGDTCVDMAEIRLRSRLTLRKTGKFVEWPVHGFLQATRQDERLHQLAVIEDPLKAEEKWPADESHALIVGVPSETLLNDLLLDLVRPVISAIHPAIAA